MKFKRYDNQRLECREINTSTGNDKQKMSKFYNGENKEKQ